MEHIYASDQENVYVNLMVDSVLSGEENLEISTEMEKGSVVIRCGKDMDSSLHAVRVRKSVWNCLSDYDS